MLWRKLEPDFRKLCVKCGVKLQPPRPSNISEERKKVFSDPSVISQERRLSYFRSPAFQKALAAGLEGLSKDLGEDGTSQYLGPCWIQ